MREFKYAMLNVLTGFGWLTIEKMTGLHDRYIHLHPSYTFIGVIFPFIVYFFAFREEKKARITAGKTFTFRQGIEYGSVMTVMTAPFAAAGVFLFLKFVSPEFFKYGIEFATLKLGKNQADAESYFNMTSYVGNTFLGTFVIGAVVTVVMCLIFKTKTVNNLSRETA